MAGVGTEKVAFGVKSSNIPEMRQDRTKVTIEDQLEVLYALSIGAKIIDLEWPWRVIMHSVSKHVRQGVVVYLFLVSHSVCF